MGHSADEHDPVFDTEVLSVLPQLRDLGIVQSFAPRTSSDHQLGVDSVSLHRVRHKYPTAELGEPAERQGIVGT